MNVEIENDNLCVLSRVVGPIQTSIYVLGCKRSKEAVIIDAGGDSDALVEAIDARSWTLTEVWQTHAHVDHVAGLNDLKDRRDVPILLHEAEQPVYDAAVQQGMMFGFQIEPLPTVEKYVEEGDFVNVGELKAEVLWLPGHSPGSVAFYFKDEGLFFGGDVVFKGSVGRVDLPGCDPKAMRRSLDRVKKLPDDTIILPGHGPRTTVGEEKRSNPFLR